MYPNALAITHLLTAVASFIAAFACWHLRSGRWLAFMMMAVAIYALGDSVVVSKSASFQVQHAWFVIEYAGVLALPVCIPFFFLDYARLDRWITRRNVVLVSIVPCVDLVLILTNSWHRLIWAGFSKDASGVFVANGFGAFWLVGVLGYLYLMIALGTVVGAWAVLRFPTPYKRQAAVLLASTALPWTASVLFMSGKISVPHWDPMPQAIALWGIAFAWTLACDRFGDLLPVARDALVGRMTTGVIVLDGQDRVVDVNAAARRLLCLADGALIGADIQGVATKIAPDAWQFGADESRLEIALEDVGSPRHVELRVSPVHDRRGRHGGRLIVANDVTERKLAEMERERLLTDLQQALAEVKTLSGLLPICSSCKKVREDTGYWTQIEHYIQTHSDAVFSHGICPECAAEFREQARALQAPPPARGPVKDD